MIIYRYVRVCRQTRQSLGCHGNQFIYVVRRIPYLTSRASRVCTLSVRMYKRNVLINFLMNFQVYFVRHLVCLASSNVLSSSVTSVNICSLNLHKVERSTYESSHTANETQNEKHTYANTRTMMWNCSEKGYLYKT